MLTQTLFSLNAAHNCSISDKTCWKELYFFKLLSQDQLHLFPDHKTVSSFWQNEAFSVQLMVFVSFTKANADTQLSLTLCVASHHSAGQETLKASLIFIFD